MNQFVLANNFLPASEQGRFSALLIFTVLLGFAGTVPAQIKQSNTRSISNQTPKERIKMFHAKGTFEVNVTPQKADNQPAETAQLGRMSIDKKFSGALEATSTGEMLTVGTDVEGSGGYVAIERVNGKLNGKTGSFVLQHLGTMTKTGFSMKVTVLPDSGTGQLAGITGNLTVTIENGKHFYAFEYSLP